MQELVSLLRIAVQIPRLVFQSFNRVLQIDLGKDKCRAGLNFVAFSFRHIIVF